MRDRAPNRLSRRSFLGTAIATGAAAAITGDLAVESSAGAVLVAAPIRAAAYRGLIGSTFYVRTGWVQRRLTLLAVDDLHMEGLPHHTYAGQSRTTGEQFSLMFRGSGAVRIAQGTYSIAHRGLRTHQLFIVPVGARGRFQSYQAIIVSV